ncbi:MAG: alternative ribosome rescue aminoacyl-tRNA hydrolase ArfB [Lentimicrobiaceae bacterium]|nr:alternative ribosome rescue aminoacyl-tRNA hydrolase ArfB [Lentimicrobiaceae bacterium]
MSDLNGVFAKVAMEKSDNRYGLPDLGSELELTTSLSSGRGGQHINKTETRVELHFDVLNSRLLSDSQREQILVALSKRISKKGFLRMYAQKHRSQPANREDVISRFYQLLAKALECKKPRIKTQLPGAEKTRRLDNKKLQSVKKQLRKPPEI